MKKTVLATLAAAILTVPAFAGDYERIVVEAKKTQLEAQELSTLLKSKKADLADASSKLDRLEAHAMEVKKLVGEADGSSLTPAQKMDFDRMKTAAEVMAIFVTNKRALMTDDAAKNRVLLRAKADGIAQRAEMVQRSATRLRS